MLSVLLASSALVAPLVQTTSECVDGRRHNIAATYSTGSNAFVDLDADDMASQLSGVTCDAKGSWLQLTFKDSGFAVAWLAKLGGRTNQFIVGGAQWNCMSLAKMPTHILVRVHSASATGTALTLRTSMAAYDEVFENAEIHFGTAADTSCAAKLAAPDPSVTKHVCVGANSDCVGHSKSVLPIYNSSTGVMKAACSDCMADLISDVFASFHFGGLLHPKQSSIKAGFANTTLDAHINVDLSAVNHTTLAVSKAFELVSKKYVINFKVGPVPFQLYFDVPLNLLAELTLAGAVDVELGANAVFSLGEVSISWDPIHNFNHSSPKLSHTITPMVSGHAAAGVKGDLTLIPQFNLHFDRLLSASITAHPKLHSALSLATADKNICLNASYDLDLVAEADLDFVVTEHWGPNAIGNWSGVPIPQKCIKV